MLLEISKFGGLAPKVLDPSLLPPNKSVTAQNVRFDQGGIDALLTDLEVLNLGAITPPVSIFPYYNEGSQYFFRWATDVDAIKTPLLSDSYNRVFYTEGGVLKVTDKNLFSELSPSLKTANWDVVAGWDLSADTLDHNSAGAGAITPITTIPVVAGRSYLVTIVVSALTVGNCAYTLGGTAGTTLVAATTYTETLIATNTGDLTFTPSSAAARFTISSISIKTLNTAESGYPTKYRYPCPPVPLIEVMPYVKPEPDPVTDQLTTPASCSASSESGGNVAENAIADDTDVTYWLSTAMVGTLGKPKEPNAATRPWWQYDFGAGYAQAINTMTMGYDDGNGNVGPDSFVVLASDTGAFAGEEVILYQTSGLTSQWTAAYQVLTFSWQNETAYRYIRILITVANDTVTGQQMEIDELEMYYVFPAPDPTLLESRVYVRTYVNGYGQEGPPSDIDVANLQSVDVYDGNPVTLSWTADTLDELYDVVSQRIYRSNQNALDVAQFQLLDEIDIDEVSYEDVKVNTQLGEVLPSLLWDVPPTGLAGLISLPNGVTAGFVDNLVCFTPPYFPHAWPMTYRYPCDANVVGLGAFGTTVIALTEGNPYVFVVNDPASVVWEKLGSAFSCLEKRGIVDAGNVVIYPSPEGLIGISANGLDLITKDDMTGTQWTSTYTPSSLNGFYWEGKYIGFCDNGVTKSGFMFDLKTRDLTNLNFYAYGGYYDPIDGTLYLVTLDDTDAIIGSFNDGNSTRTISYKTGRRRFPTASFGVIKVLATAYPVDLTLYSQIYDSATGLILNTNLLSVAVANDQPRRINCPYLIDNLDVQISDPLTAIYLASIPGELPL